MLVPGGLARESGGSVNNVGVGSEFVEEVEVPASPQKQEDVIDNLKSMFSRGELVWIASDSESWWPGQICDPLDEPKSAAKSHNTDCLFVRYFGNGKFDWCGPSQLKRFNENFEQMSTQSDSKSFTVALQKAVSEFSRRVKWEMTCSCNSQDKLSIIAGQVSGSAKGGKRISMPHAKSIEYSVTQFEPSVFLSYLKKLAQVGSLSSKLECTVVQSHLWAYFCSIGHSQMRLSQLRDVNGQTGDRNPELVEADFPRNNEKEKEDTGSEGTDKKAGKGFDLRGERKKSRYLSYPYTKCVLGPKGVPQSETRVFKTITGSSDGMPVLKSSSNKYHKKLLRKPLDSSKCLEVINKSSAELLSELHMAALDSLYPKESNQFDSIETLFSMLRRSVYQDISKLSADYSIVIDSQDMGSPAPDVKPDRKRRMKKEGKTPVPLPATVPDLENSQVISHVKSQRKKRVKKEGTALAPLPATGTTVPTPDSESSLAMSPVVKPQRKKRVKKEGTDLSPLPASGPALAPLSDLGTAPVPVLTPGTTPMPVMAIGIAPAPLLATGTTAPIPYLENSQAMSPVVKPKRKKREKEGTPLTTTGTAMPPLTATGTAMQPLTATGTAMPPLTATGTAMPPLIATGTAMPPLTTTGTAMPPLTATGTAPGSVLATGTALGPFLPTETAPGPFLATETAPTPFPIIGTTVQLLDFENAQIIYHNASEGKLKPKKRIKEEAKLGCSHNSTTANIGLTCLNGNNVKPISLVVDLHMGPQLNSEARESATSVNLNTNPGANTPFVNGSILSFETELQGKETRIAVSENTSLAVAIPGINGISESHEKKLPGPKKRKKKEEATINCRVSITGVPDLNFNGVESAMVGRDSHEVKPVRKRMKKSEDQNFKNSKAANIREAFRTTLLLTFGIGFPIPSKEVLITTFSRFLSFKESETSTFEDSNSANIVFATNDDAAEAVKFLETDKPFGEALIDYKFQHLSASYVGLESERNLQILPINSMEAAKKNSNSIGEAPPLSVVRQNLQIMMAMLEKAGDDLSADMKVKLEADIKILMRKVSTITGCSS